MRKPILIIAAVAATWVSAQNSNVVSAYMALEDNKLAEAAEFIEPAILNEGTMVKEKTWRYRGMIYQRIAFSDDAAIKAKYPDALDKAIASFTKANELDKKGSEKADNDRALRGLQGMALNAGNDAFTAKEYDKAIMLYAQSEAVAKTFGEVDSNAVFNSALAYESKGDLAKAKEKYLECIRIGYDKPEVYRYTASLQDRTNELDGAIATTQAGRKRYPDSKDLMLDEIHYLQKAGRGSEVEASVKAAVEKDPGNCVLHSVLAGIYEAKGEFDLAEAGYKKSIACDPKFFDAYFNVGVLYNNRAAAEYERCNDIKDDATYNKCKKGADEIIAQALPYFEQAHGLKPDDKPTIQQLQTLYTRVGNTEKALEMKKLLGE